MVGKIRELRTAKGMTQEELAVATGISLRTIQRIEQGKVVPRAFSLKKIAEALGINISEFYQHDETPKTDLNSFLTRFDKKIFSKVFYSIWSSLLFLLLLLNISSQFVRPYFLNSEPFFKNDLQILHSLISIACLIALLLIYSLYQGKHRLKEGSYWILLATFSVITMYLAYTNRFVNATYFYINSAQFYLSFLNWLVLLFFGVAYKALIREE